MNTDPALQDPRPIGRHALISMLLAKILTAREAENKTSARPS
jgi:hypothetical protein